MITSEAQCVSITLNDIMADVAFTVALISCEFPCLVIDKAAKHTHTSLWRVVTSAGRLVTRIPGERPGHPIKEKRRKNRLQISSRIRLVHTSHSVWGITSPLIYPTRKCICQIFAVDNLLTQFIKFHFISIPIFN